MKKTTWLTVGLALFAATQLASTGKQIANTNLTPAAAAAQTTNGVGEPPAPVQAIRRLYNPEGVAAERLIKNEIERTYRRRQESAKIMDDLAALAEKQNAQVREEAADTQAKLQMLK